MSTSITHKVIVGFKVYFKDIYVLDKEAEYKTKKRYCQNTGKELKPQLIEITPSKYHYEFEGKSYDDPYEILNDHSGFNGVDYFYIGETFGEYQDMDYFACNIGEITETEIQEKFSKMREKYPDRDIKLHMDYQVW